MSNLVGSIFGGAIIDFMNIGASMGLFGLSAIYGLARANGYIGGFFKNSALLPISMTLLGTWIVIEWAMHKEFIPPINNRQDDVKLALKLKLAAFCVFLF